MTSCEQGWEDGPVNHDPWCELYSSDPNREGTLPCHCIEETMTYRAARPDPQDPILEREFGSGTWDASAWLECVDAHDSVCPALVYEDDDACLCRTIARARADEKSRVSRWLNRHFQIPVSALPAATQEDVQEEAVLDPDWHHGDIRRDSEAGFVTCLDCGAHGWTLEQLRKRPCALPTPYWFDKVA